MSGSITDNLVQALMAQLMAQGSKGSRVPPDSVYDVEPRYMLPQVGNEKDTRILSNQQLQGKADEQRSNELLSKLSDINAQIQKSPGSSDPNWQNLQAQFDDIRGQLQDIQDNFMDNTRPGRMLKNIQEREQNVPSDVDAILKGMKQQQPPPEQPSTIPMSDVHNMLLQLADSIMPQQEGTI